MPYRLRRIVGA